MGAATNAPLTIVLTLKDRAPFTYRWMRYMDDVRCPYPILIADGGEDAAAESRLRQPGNYPNLTYTYLRYPFDEDYGTYYRKLADVITRVATPYLLFADNDDFFFLEHVPAFIRRSSAMPVPCRAEAHGLPCASARTTTRWWARRRQWATRQRWMRAPSR